MIIGVLTVELTTRQTALTTMPRTLFSHSDCRARLTESKVVVPIRTTNMVPSHMVENIAAGSE